MAIATTSSTSLDERIELAFKSGAGRQRGYLTFDGKPACLAGRLPSSGSPIVHPNRLTERATIKSTVRELARQDNNLFKWWMLAYWLYADHTGDRHSFFSPFARTAAGKWDAALDLTLREAMRHGIVVQIGLFDGPGLKGTGASDGTLRWPANPWNAKNNVQGAIVATDAAGASRVFFTDTGIRPFQRRYVEEVVARTRNYWNVVYEVMNEPGGDLAAEIAWADQVVGWIDAQTGGRRIVLYNTFPDRRDIQEWRKKDSLGRHVYPNYPRFHGVIFHGDPTAVNPETIGFSAEKALQASSDAADRTLRDTFEWNRTRTVHSLRHDLSFQAHTISPEAGRGIQAAVVDVAPGDRRQTLPLVPWRLLGRFHRRVPDQAFDLRFFPDGVFVGFATNPLREIDRGRITPLGRDRLHSVRANGEVSTWRYSLDESGAVPRLKMTREGSDPLRQELDLVSYPGSADDDTVYGRFLFNWEREHASDGSPHFHLRFDVDGSFLAYRPGPPAVELLRGDVANLGSDAQGPFVELFSAARSSERWTYRFLQGGAKLELSTGGFTQRFVRPGGVSAGPVDRRSPRRRRPPPQWRPASAVPAELTPRGWPGTP